MPRSQAQSDFTVTRAPAAELPAGAQAGELATRWILRLTVVLLALLAVLCVVGPHIPVGE